MTVSTTATPVLGVILVAYNSGDVLLDCLECLLTSTGVRLVIQVVDNASPDDTRATLRDWADGRRPAALEGLPFACPPQAGAPRQILDRHETVPDSGHAIALRQAGGNLGFAGGVNVGLAELARLPEINRFWVLNPDTLVPPGTAAAFATYPAPPNGFSLMGGRLLFQDCPNKIQIDGGIISPWSGVTHNVNQYRTPEDTTIPDAAALDFITGASMVASRRFYETVGPMREDYFLYYEEVDWALRRGDLPLVVCPQAIVYHGAGTSIGSASPRGPASAFSVYFKSRARMMFLRRLFPRYVASGWAWSLAKAAQLRLRGDTAAAAALLAGAARRPPPPGVAAKLSPDALARITAPAGADRRPGMGL